MTVTSLALRVPLRRLMLPALLAAWVALLFVSTSQTAFARTSSIVIDAETGRVLSQSDADAPNYPASLTKMMTLYLVFEGLEQGRLTLGQLFTVSQHAASQAPSKLDLQPGTMVALKDLILGLVTKSANDAAVVVAENLAGSEPAFAERMTRKARLLGMTNSTFRNASGLPNPEQLTTARDLATLALAVYRDFPREYHYFSTEDFTFRGVTYVNHNHLMQSFAGMDGIKTGYIRASGFNLAASAVRDGRRIIAVIMGGESAHSRDMKMAQLLDVAFARPSAPPVNVAEDQNPAESQDGLAHQAGRAIAALSPVGNAEAATAHENESRERRANLAVQTWGIQVGAFGGHATAVRVAAQTLARLPSPKGKAIIVLPPSPAEKEPLYRARIAHFTERDAQVACRLLQKRHQPCVVLAPETMRVAAK